MQKRNIEGHKQNGNYKANQNENDMSYKGIDKCIEKAADNEMLFVLRAQDKSAPKVVLHWIAKNFENVSDEKLREAFECALEMKRWPTRKEPD
jgi:hypothetical protein